MSEEEIVELRDKVASLEQRITELTDPSDVLDDPINILTPFEANLTAPIAASAELGKWYIVGTKMSKLFMRTIHIDKDENDNIMSISMHPDAKWWAKFSTDILKESAKLTANRENKIIENKANIMAEFVKGADPEIQQKVGKKVLQAMYNEFSGSKSE